MQKTFTRKRIFTSVLHAPLFLAFVAFTAVTDMSAQTAGTLDATFGTAGVVKTNLGKNENAYSLDIQSDGKIVAAGIIAPTSGNLLSSDSIIVLRYNINGTLDNTFGTNGAVKAAHANVSVKACKVLPDGKILVAGGKTNDAFVVKYNANGTLDNTFGTAGEFIISFGATVDEFFSIAVQADGKILLGGGSSDDFNAVRITAGGILDNSFGTSGKTSVDFGNVENSFGALLLQPDGKIILCGSSTYTSTTNYVNVARLTSAGALDNTFGTGGKVETSVGSSSLNAFVSSACLQSDGKIIIAGQKKYLGSASVYHHNFLVLSYNADGTPNASFGTAGIANFNYLNNSVDRAFSVAQQSDGNLVIGGKVNTSSWGLLRISTIGVIDNTFGTAGWSAFVTTDAFHQFTGMIIGNDAKIYLSGYSGPTGTTIDASLARYYTGLPPAGIHEMSHSNITLSIFPNPATGYFTFSKDENFTDSNVEIYNTLGKLVKTTILDETHTVNTNDLSSGIYYVSLKNTKVSAKTVKLIIQ